MTRKEFIEKYGDIEVTFSSYYKYTFTYRADLDDGSAINVSFGGNADEIYRFNVVNNDKSTVKDLDPYSGAIYKDSKEVCSFYDY